MTQYLRPSMRHHRVHRWVKPEEFVEHADTASQMGFAGVLAGPLVRSSYGAGRLYAQTMRRRGGPLPQGLEHLAVADAAGPEARSLLDR
jgi:lipoyl synthase